MSRFGFVGASYVSQSVNADAEKCENWYVESIESPGGKSALALYPTAGSTLFTALTGPSVRGGITFNGRTFFVAGVNFYEVFANGTSTLWGQVANDGLPVSFTAGPDQILAASAGVMYVFTLSTNTAGTVDPATYVGPVQSVAYIDGFFIALFKNSGEFQVSTPDDATSWDLTNVAIVSVFGDNVLAMIANYRQLQMFGPKQSVVYYDSGNIFPFDVVPGGFIEQGTTAQWSPCFMDNSVFALGGDARGAGIAWRYNGYSPVRVSNHAVEHAWSQYPTITDAISYTFQDQGHTFWHLYFPSANKSWRYDAATQLWHEVSFLDPATGRSTAHRSQCYVYAFGQHLVGDWASGNVYALSINTYTDFGNPIRRVRQSPHISSEQQWAFHSQMQIDMEVGLAPEPPLVDGNNKPRAPIVNLSWSDDGGHAFSNEYPMSCGLAGEYKQRVIWRRLGRTRDRVYRLTATDPVPYRIIDAYLQADPGYAVQERYASQIRKIS